MDSASFLAQQKMAELIKYGVIIIGSLPPLLIYPFIQKHLKKGVMIGSVKGKYRKKVIFDLNIVNIYLRRND